MSLLSKDKLAPRRWLPLTVMGYMALAIGWWSILLYRVLTENYHLHLEKLQAESARQIVENSYRRELFMILGEGFVFILILGIGLYLINKSYYRELDTAHQKRNFLLSVTHELKSPIAGIKLALQTLRKHQLAEKQRSQLLDASIEENDRLNRLVNNLLLAAKIDKNYFQEKINIDLNQEINQCLEKVQSQYPNAHIKYTEQATDSILFDQQGIQSVLCNLIENSVKYSPDHIDIVISTLNHPHYVEINVADQGIGIPPKERKKVFQQFYRIGSEETRKSKGTGLGLYIVKKVLEGHNATIEIKDNQPKGTIFNIKIPKQ